MRGLVRALVAVALVFAVTGCAAFKKPGSSTTSIVSSGRDPGAIYDHATLMLRRGLFEKAMTDFQELRTFHRDDPLSVKAQLGIADLQFRKGEFEEARYAYEEFATYHPRHPDLDYVTWRIGQCIWKRAPKVSGRDQTTTRSAVNTWSGFEQRFPESEHLEDVARLHQRGIDRLAAKELFIARFYAKRDAWLAVAGRADGLLVRFPASTHAEEALALLALAHQETGREGDAVIARDKLAQTYPGSNLLTAVDRRLAKPPGEPPEAQIFARPYRVPGLDPSTGQPSQ